MPDEAESPESGIYTGQLPRWSKKKSTEPVNDPPAQKEENKSQNDTSRANESLTKPTETESPLTIKVSINQDEHSEDTETPSLFRRKAKEVHQGSDVKPKKNEQFSQEDIDTTWKVFATKRGEIGVGDAEKLVLTRRLFKRGENDIEIALGSQLEISILEKFETELVQFFRQELSNDLLLLKKKVIEQQTEKKLYTSQDKYEHMLEKNPSIKLLVEKLGLDFEY